jgi:hypothetical protein
MPKRKLSFHISGITFNHHEANSCVFSTNQREEIRLCGIADFLNYGSKLQMEKPVLASLTYVACAA